VNEATVVCEAAGVAKDVTAVDSWTVNLFQPSVEVEKTGPVTTCIRDIVYTFHINNTSSDDSPPLVLSSTVDSILGDFTDEARAAGCDPLNPLPPGESCHFTVPYFIPTGTDSPLTNTVTVTYHPEGFSNVITDTDAHTVILLPDLVITKTTPLTEVAPGGRITYTVVYSNVGIGPAEEGSITDTLPPTVTFREVVEEEPDLYGPTVELHSLTWHTPLLPAGTGGYIIFTVDVDHNAVTSDTLINTVTIASSSHDCDSGNNEAQTATHVRGDTDVTITKTVTPTQVPRGGLLTYSITYCNDSDTLAEEVVISDTMPSGMYYVTDTSGLTCMACNPGARGTLTWTVGTLTPRTCSSFTLILREDNSNPCSATLTNTVSITTTTPDRDLTNNRDYATSHVIGPEVTIAKEVDPDDAAHGDVITYTIDYSNVGQADARDVYIIDTLPHGVDFGGVVIEEPPLYSPTQTGQAQTWFTPTLPEGVSGFIIFTATIAPNAVASTTLPNTVTITTITPECGDEPNEASASVHIRGPDVTITKTTQLTEVKAGGIIPYVITYCNVGNAPAENVEITDILPEWTSYEDSSRSPDSSNPLLWTVGTLMPNDCDSLTLTLKVDSDTPFSTTLINRVTIGTSTPECGNQPNEDDAPSMHVIPDVEAKLYLANDGEDADDNPDNDERGTLEMFSLPGLIHLKTIVPDDEPPWEDPWGMAVYSPCLFVGDFNERGGESGREPSHLYAINTNSDQVVDSITVPREKVPSCISNNPEDPPEPPPGKSTHSVHVAVLTSSNKVYIYVANHSNPPVVTVFSAALGDPTCQMTMVITRKVNESDASSWCRWSTSDWGFFGATAAPEEGCVYLTKRQHGSTGIWRMCLPDNELEYVGPTDSLEDCGWYDEVGVWKPQPSDPCYPQSALFDQVADLGEGISAASGYSPSTAWDVCGSGDALNGDGGVWADYFGPLAQCDPPQQDRDHWDKARPFSILYHNDNLYVDFALIDQVWEVDPDDLLDPIEPDAEGRCHQCCPSTCSWWDEDEGPYPVYHEDQNPYDPCQKPECPWDVWPGDEPPKPRFEHITMTTDHQDPQPDSAHGGQGLVASGECIFVSCYLSETAMPIGQACPLTAAQPSLPITSTDQFTYHVYLPAASKNFGVENPDPSGDCGPDAPSSLYELGGRPKGMAIWEGEDRTLLFVTLPIVTECESRDWIAVFDAETGESIDYIKYKEDVPNAPPGFSHRHPHSAITVDLGED